MCIREMHAKSVEGTGRGCFVASRLFAKKMQTLVNDFARGSETEKCNAIWKLRMFTFKVKVVPFEMCWLQHVQCVCRGTL